MIWPASTVKQQLTINHFYSFFEVHRDTGFHFPGETHNFWECVYLLDGSIIASGDDRVYTLTRNDMIIHKPLELHKYFVESAAGAELLIFSFDLDGHLADTLKNKVFNLSDYQKNLIYSLLDYVRKHYDSTFNTNNMIEHQYLQAFDVLPVYSQTVTSYLYLLFLSLAGDGIVADISTAPDAQVYHKAVSYMNDHICEQPSIPEIAAFCNISVSTLKRIFTKFAGISIHKYFLKLKMQAATSLLKNGNSVIETAEKLGFSSQAYFSSTFKRETGENPSNICRSLPGKPPF